MSGGSFNYLYCKDAADLMQGHHEDFEYMLDALAATGYANDVAQETAWLMNELRAASIRIEAKIKRLEGPWHAMEWWKSCDWSENDFKRAVAEYRGIDLPDCKRCNGSGREPNKESPLACRNPDCARGKDVENVR